MEDDTVLMMGLKNFHYGSIDRESLRNLFIFYLFHQINLHTQIL